MNEGGGGGPHEYNQAFLFVFIPCIVCYCITRYYNTYFISFKMHEHVYLLAPPDERQRNFSNADSSVVVRRRPSSSSVVGINFSPK